jgi:hypothetical protein
MPRGYNESGDLVIRTADGRELNVIWTEIQEAMRFASERRSGLDDLLTRNVVVAAEDIIEAVGTEELEIASEFGEPSGVRAAPGYLTRGAQFQWFDKASRFTWQYLAKATSEQVLDAANRMLEADSKTTHKAVLGRLFNNIAQPNLNEVKAPVWSLYNADGEVPQTYEGQSFAGSHTHFMTTGAATFTTATGAANDLEALINAVVEHGFGGSDGGRIVIFANKAEVDVIRTLRVGLGTPPALFDFIPGAGAAAFLTDQNLIGTRAPVETETGLPIAGSYSDAWIVPSWEIPAGYLLAVATYGANSERNVVSFREDPSPSLQGFRLVKGKTPDYPLIDSISVRGFGTGIRRRGAAAVMQVTAGAYTNPAAFAAPNIFNA